VGACVQGPADRPRNRFFPFWCAIVCARDNHMKSGPIDRAGLSQVHTLLRSLPTYTNLFAHKRGNECGPQRRGNGRGNPACPCGIVRCLFSWVKDSGPHRNPGDPSSEARHKGSQHTTGQQPRSMIFNAETVGRTYQALNRVVTPSDIRISVGHSSLESK
jgi:hypothetical protein